MMQALLLMLTCGLLAAATPEPPQQVFKCADGHGVSYQATPCAGRTLGTWKVTREARATPTHTPPAPGARVHKPHRAQQRAPRPGRAKPSRKPVPDACRQAREGRAKAYAKAGLKRDFTLSSHWDNRVHEACWWVTPLQK